MPVSGISFEIKVQAMDYKLWERIKATLGGFEAKHVF